MWCSMCISRKAIKELKIVDEYLNGFNSWLVVITIRIVKLDVIHINEPKKEVNCIWKKPERLKY